MNATAYQIIKDTYDYETCKEIVSHGCKSGVCSEHIYYADTIGFFDEHEDEIVAFIIDSVGADGLGEILAKNDGDLDMYKNDCTWCFIEFVAMDVLDEYNERQAYPDLDYSLADSITEDAVKLNQGYNPPNSMNMSRYAHAG